MPTYAAVALTFVLLVAVLVCCAAYLALRPPIEGDVGDWQHRDNNRRFRASIKPGGHEVELVDEHGNICTVTRDYFVRAFDKSRKQPRS